MSGRFEQLNKVLDEAEARARREAAARPPIWRAYGPWKPPYDDPELRKKLKHWRPKDEAR